MSVYWTSACALQSFELPRGSQIKALDVEVDGGQRYDEGNEDWSRCCDEYQCIQGAYGIHKQLLRISLNPIEAIGDLTMLKVRARTSSTRYMSLPALSVKRTTCHCSSVMHAPCSEPSKMAWWRRARRTLRTG